jgi:pimeloyl-ACP methyl ester carboxylesterase
MNLFDLYLNSRSQLFRILSITLLLLFHSINTPAQTPAFQGHMDLPGVKLWYEDTGGPGEVIVLMHAATGNNRFWQFQVPAFTEAGYRVIAFERRGWGRTIIDETGPQPGTASDDLIGLMDRLNIDKFHMVATAAGGSIAWDLSLSFPERLLSMVIACNSGRVQDQAYRDLVASLQPPQWDELPPEFRELGPLYRATNPEGTKRWIELEHYSRPLGLLLPSQPLKQTLTFDALEDVTTPVLIIRGGADLASPAPMSRFFSDRVPHAETLVIPDAGHSAFWETPEIFNQAVLEFIGKQ